MSDIDFRYFDYTVTISGEEREDGEAPYTYVVTAESPAMAIHYALLAHGPAFGLRLETITSGAPADDCGYTGNDLRPQWRKTVKEDA